MSSLECSRAQGDPFRAPRRLSLSMVVLTICVCVLGLGLVVADAQAETTYPLVPVSAKVGTCYRGWLAPADGAQLAATVQVDGTSSGGASMPEDGIRAGAFIEIGAQVHDLEADPVPGAVVSFEWTSEGGPTHRYFGTTDERGVASVRRWVSEQERGKPAAVIVSVDTPDWSACRYASFVPK